MEFVRSLFVTITILVPNVIAQIALKFAFFIGARRAPQTPPAEPSRLQRRPKAGPYWNSRKTSVILRRNKLNSGILLIAIYFLFAFVVGIPTISTPYFDIAEGWKNSLERVNDIDLKGRQFVYLVVFILALSILTMVVTHVLKRLYKVQGRRGVEFQSIFPIFVAFTIGWFLILTFLQNLLFHFLGPVIGEHWQRWTISQSDLGRKLADGVGRFYCLYNPHQYQCEIIPGQPEAPFQHFLILFATPATIIILLMTWRFSSGMLQELSIKQENILLRFNSRIWSIQARSATFAAVLVLLFCSATAISGLANILFSPVAAETHKEDCVVTEENQLPVMVRSRYSENFDKFPPKKIFNINLYYFNNERTTKVLTPLYLALFDVDEFESQKNYFKILHPAYAGEKDDYIQNDSVKKIVRIDASQLFWLNGKGIIVEGGERRYFRLRFPVEQLEPGLEPGKSVGGLECKLLLPASRSNVKLKDLGPGAVKLQDFGPDTEPFRWELTVQGLVDEEKPMIATNITDVSGDSISAEPVNAAPNAETTEQH